MKSQKVIISPFVVSNRLRKQTESTNHESLQISYTVKQIFLEMVALITVGLFFCISTYAAEQVICLDEVLLNKEVESILRSRGVEPYPLQAAQKRNIEERIMQFSCKKRRDPRISHAYLTRLREKKELSITDLYALGFLFLQMGNPKEAKSFWHRVALHYPITDSSEFKAKSALELLSHSSLPFALIKVPLLQQQTDTALLFFLPTRMSTLFSALVEG